MCKVRNYMDWNNGKRNATPEETEAAIISVHRNWNAMNPGFEHDVEFWKSKQDEAVKEGYKSEVCKCGVVFLAFHHWCRCSAEGCPMSNGVSMLDMMIRETIKEIDKNVIEDVIGNQI